MTRRSRYSDLVPADLSGISARTRAALLRGVRGGDGPIAAPPAVDPGPGGLDGAGQAARDRLEEAFPQGLPPGAPAEAAAAAVAPPAPSEFDLFADGSIEGLQLDGLQYRDGKKLESELVRARDQYKPFRDAFGALDEDQRAALLEAAPSLGADLSTFGAVAQQLHPDDRAYFMNAMAKFATDPLGAAEMLAAGADLVRSAYAQPGQPPAAPQQLPPGTQPMPEWAEPPADPMDAPMTRREFENLTAERDYANVVRTEEAQILAQARELGYDPESNDPAQDARFRTLISLAGRPEVSGDLTKAHAYIEAMDQAAIDRFVAAKSADAGRPGAPAMGAAPAMEAPALVTNDDARTAMLARMEGVLGPDPRRRGSDD